MADNILNIKVKFSGKEAENGANSLSRSLKNLENDATKSNNNVANSFKKVGESISNLSKTGIDKLKNGYTRANNAIISSTSKTADKADDASSSFLKLGGIVKAVFAGVAVNAIINQLQESIDIAKKAQVSFTAFSSVVKAKSVDMSKAMEAVNYISKEGAVTMTETQQAMQNLLQRGYSVNQAKEALDVLRNSAAFGKAAHLEFGEAIVSATEGLRQENSILVDNAGITTNVAKMWENYAKQIGVTTESLSQNQKIEAELMGIRAEATIHMGNYQKMLETTTGREAMHNAEMQKAKQIIGEQLMPAYESITKIANKASTASIGFLSSMIVEFKKAGLSSLLSKELDKVQKMYLDGEISLEEHNKRVLRIYKNAEKQMNKINDQASGADKIDPKAGNKTAKDVWDEQAKANEKAMAEAIEYEKNIEKLKVKQTENEIEELKNQKIALETNLEKKLITYEEYAKDVKKIISSIDEKEREVASKTIAQLESKLNVAGLTDDQKANVQGEISKQKSGMFKNALSNAKEINSIDEKLSGGNNKKTQSFQSFDYKGAYQDQLNQNEANIFRNNNNREIKLNEEKLEDFLISYEEYYSKKEELTKRAFDYELNYLNRQKAEIQKMPATNEEQKFQKMTEIAKITGDINNLENERLNAIEEINREQEKHNKLKQQTLDLMENELNYARKLSEVDIQNTKVGASSNLGLITKEQEIQAEQYFADERYKIEKELIEKNMALYAKDSEDYQNYLNALKQLDISYATEKQKLNIDMQTAQLQDTANMMKTFEDGFINIAQSATQGAESVKEAFKSMGNAIMMELIAIEAKIIARKLLSQLFGVNLDGNQVNPGGILGIGNAGRQSGISGIANGLIGAIPGLGGATTNNNLGGNTTNNNNITQNISIQGGLGGGGDKSTLSQIFNGIGGAITKAIGSIG